MRHAHGRPVFVSKWAAFRPRFVAYGLPESCVEELRELIETFERAMRNREALRSAQAAAQAAMTSDWLDGLAAVRRLDVIVENQPHDDPMVMAAQASDRRVEYRTRSRRATSNPSAPTGTPASRPSIARTDRDN
jgi:hypothetical protein